MFYCLYYARQIQFALSYLILSYPFLSILSYLILSYLSMPQNDSLCAMSKSIAYTLDEYLNSVVVYLWTIDLYLQAIVTF